LNSIGIHFVLFLKKDDSNVYYHEMFKEIIK